jgi:hypothetical protein
MLMLNLLNTFGSSLSPDVTLYYVNDVFTLIYFIQILKNMLSTML